MPPITLPKICFSIPVSPNDHFYSQIAMFRLALDALGGTYKDADIILTLGDGEIKPIPDRWRTYFGNNIKYNWVSPLLYQRYSYGAQGDARLQYDYDGYDIVILCDADTLLVKPIDDVLTRMMQSPSVMGVIAHYHPFAPTTTIKNKFINKILSWLFGQNTPNINGQVSHTDHDFSPRQIWIELADQFVGKPIEFNYRYSLVSRDIPSEFANSPFYVNYGFVVATPKIIKTIEATYFDIRPKLASNKKLRYYAFSGQIALALSLLAHDIPTFELGLRYNFPNDPTADNLRPTELGDVRLIHYLNTNKFNRHIIFTNEDAFNDFLSLNLRGSNKIFQEYIRKLTNGRYPFRFRQSGIERRRTQDKIEAVNKKVVVVLGMHRSGTSVIARGLQVLGVELGDNLMPPGSGDNDKGYWEDIDLNAINIEMLRSLNSDWHFLAPIQTVDVDVLRRDGYIQRAVDILHEKIADVQIFGFKDPRVAKLLPIWKEAFAQSGVKVSYVLALRNPLSVAKSLARRDGFDFEKSSLLWLEHVIGSLAGTLGENCVVVDYDRLMQMPEAELNRVANGLQLQIDLSKLEQFKVEFLDDGLRHSKHQLNDLERETLIFPIVKEIYLTLLGIATDNVSLEDADTREKIAQWGKEFSSMISVMAFLDKLDLRIRKQDAQIQLLSAQLKEIFASRAWKFVVLLRQIRGRLLPPRN